MPKLENQLQKSDRSPKILEWKLTFIRLVSYKNPFFQKQIGHSECVVADRKMGKLACRRTQIFLKSA